jgi:hypothetical protein
LEQVDLFGEQNDLVAKQVDLFDEQKDLVAD